ncbi:MAG: hypothetical protein QOF83_2727 [Solirubrobacteraceae bacterium]|jgi:hypothetical protein|nr:hypothetical protein [Solirubrobacteraceae bacterium]
MTPVVPEAELLQELDAETRLAWSAYIERVRELTGDEYERVEPKSWDELQTELRRLEGERESLTHTIPDTH